MKVFQYRLRNVLRVRCKLRGAAQVELARAVQALAEAERRLATAAQDLREGAAWKYGPGGVVRASFLHRREAHLLFLRRKQLARKQDVQAAATSVHKCRAQLLAASIEARRLEKHRDREYERWRLRLKRLELRINDDLACTRAAVRMVAN